MTREAGEFVPGEAMRQRKRHLPFVGVVFIAAAAGALLAGGAAEGQAPAAAAIVAGDNFFRTIAGGPAAVTIAPGGHVDFAYPSGDSAHNVVFTGMKPSVCGISEGPAAGEAALPAKASPPSWAGGCDFTAAGSYPFVCEVHPSMTGSVTVAANAPPLPPGPAPPPPAAVPPASGVRVATIQRGFTLRGSLQVASARSRLLARAFASRRSLFGGRSAAQVQVGRTLRSSVGGSRTSFAIALTAPARRALRRNGRLAISLRLTVTSPGAAQVYTARRTVVMRPR